MNEEEKLAVLLDTLGEAVTCYQNLCRREFQAELDRLADELADKVYVYEDGVIRLIKQRRRPARKNHTQLRKTSQ